MNITPGAVVDIVTPRGMGSAIVQNIRSSDGKYDGLLVRSNDHHETVRRHEWIEDENIYVHDGERGALLVNDDDDGVVIFKDADGSITVHVIGHERSRRTVRDVNSAMKVARTYLHQNGLTNVASVIDRSPQIALGVLQDLLDVNN